jgi:hypothetical protein
MEASIEKRRPPDPTDSLPEITTELEPNSPTAPRSDQGSSSDSTQDLHDLARTSPFSPSAAGRELSKQLSRLSRSLALDEFLPEEGEEEVVSPEARATVPHHTYAVGD